jgi:hypothetical protein
VNKEDFEGLPPRVALGLLFDLVPGLANVEKPRLPLPPKFDAKLSRKAGSYCFMSEMTLTDLLWWQGKKAESMNGGGPYAEKDRKTYETLTRWVTWRQVFPNDRWHGKRGEESVTADPPSRDPALYEWGPRGGGSRHQTEREDSPPPAAADEYGDLDTDDSIPF